MDSPETFDWVRARAACSLERIFLVLSETAAGDVRAANELRPSRARFEHKSLDRKFLVIRQEDAGGVTQAASVVFELQENGIAVRRITPARAPEPIFTAKPSLTPEGECLLEVGRQQLRPWQVSRLALEDLFFFGEPG